MTRPSAQPTTFGDRYRTVALLDGRVWRGVDLFDGRSVAIKLATDDVQDREDLEREYRLLSELAHPSLSVVLDYAPARGDVPAYLVLEMVAGEPLAPGRAPAQLEDLLAQALEVLAFVHARGFVHGDLKPANLLVGTGADPALTMIDLGLAGVAGEGERGIVRGTPRYAAPAVLDGRPPTPQSDLYALGASFAEAAGWTGARPPAPDELDEDPIARRLSPRAVSVLRRLLHPDEDARYRLSAEALADLSARTRHDEAYLRPRFVGRGRELQRLRDELTRAEAGRPRHLVLAGEPGLGRRRLLERLSVEARCLGWCVAHGNAPVRTTPGTAGLLRIDPAEPPGETVDLPVVDVRTGGEEGADRTLRLGPLEQREVRELLLSVDPFARLDRRALEEVARSSGGHPGLAVAAVRSFTERPVREPLEVVGERMHELRSEWAERRLERRLAPLPGVVRRAASVLAMLEAPCFAARAARLFEREEAEVAEWLEMLRAAGVCVRRGDAYTVRDALTRVMLVDPLGADERLGWHAAAARELLHFERGARERASRARHLAAAGQASEAARCAARAGEALLQEGRAREAVRLVTRAAEEWDDGGSRQDLRRVLADAHLALGNFLAADEVLEQLEASGETGGTELRRARALEGQGLLDEAGLLLRAQLERTEELDERLRMLELLGQVEAKRGRMDDARRWTESGLALLARPSADPLAANLYNNLGVIAFMTSDLDEARRCHELAQDLRERVGDREGLSRSLNNLGNVALVTGDLARAREHYEASVRIKRDLGNRQTLGTVLGNLALTDQVQGRFGSGLALYREALALALEVGDVTGEIRSRIGLAEIHLDKGQLAGAQRHAREALAVARLSGERDTPLSEAIATSARVHVTLGRHHAGRVLCVEGLERSRRNGDVATENLLLALQASLGEAGEGATEAFRRATRALRGIGARRLTATALLWWGESDLRAGGDPADLRERCEEALAIGESLASPVLRVGARVLLGRIGVRAGDYHAAADALHQAAEEVEELGLGELSWRCSSALADMHGAAGRRHRELAWLERTVGAFRAAVQDLDPGDAEAYLSAAPRARALARLEQLVEGAES